MNTRPRYDHTHQSHVHGRFDRIIVNTAPNSKETNTIEGFIELILTSNDKYFCWTPYTAQSKDSLSESFLDLGSGQTVPSEASPIDGSTYTNYDDYRICLSLETEVYSFRRYHTLLGSPYIIVQAKEDKYSYPPLYFVDGNTKNFFLLVDELVEVTRSPTDRNLYFINDLSDPLTRSMVVSGIYEKDSYMQTAAHVAGGTFMQMGHYLAGKLPKRGQKSDKVEYVKIDPNKTVYSSLGSFELIGEEELPEIPRVEKQPDIQMQEWNMFFDEYGRILDILHVKERIFYGGVSDDVRPEAWKFLLGLYPWTSTLTERESILLRKREEYFIVKNQWLSITPEQEDNFAKYRSRKHKIDKDVVRTDRFIEQYKEKDGYYLTLLREILITYCFFNWDIGYAQGMNDLLSPILLVMEVEADAFWCFKGSMARSGKNFHKDQISLHAQFTKLANLLNFVDPGLYSYLESIDALNMFFVYRWLLILFKREFEPNDVKRIWEAIWSDFIHPDFHLFIVLGILVKQSETIISNQFLFDDLLKVCLL
eukprot:TRINITY_DN8581_c0_g1_i1.p1 TRINITY_DN8581_c0_g1~~TRINITY_DN8581_c0_g1_i1.p1  ORF type:complete len:536 (+),score=93.41 TRINITY_DN8581_c0_g1_i1:353-1960(+)